MTEDIEPRTPQNQEEKLSDTQSAEIQCWLKEYESLRNPILSIQRMMHNVIWVNLSITGAILAIYFSNLINKESLTLFLAIPIVSSLLGIYWVAQGMQIVQAANYIRDRIAPALQSLCHNSMVMASEAGIRAGKIEMPGEWRIFRLLNSVMVPRATGGAIFLVLSLAGLVMTWKEFIKPEQLEIRVIWLVALALTILLILFGMWLGQYLLKSKFIDK